MDDVTTARRSDLGGDLWGGFASMLVALPSAIGFGVAVYAPFGAAAASRGAIAGIAGAIALGITASIVGGTKRLVSAPCAPSAAVLSAATLLASQRGLDVDAASRLLALTVVSGAAAQMAFGFARFGSLIKYMPFPVVSGYLSGVGLYMILGQLPKLLGLPRGVSLGAGLVHPSYWAWSSVIVGAATAVTMVEAPRHTQRLPGVILALGAGLLTYRVLALVDPSLGALDGNRFLVGSLAAPGATNAFAWPFSGRVTLDDLRAVIVPALTLAILLSIDTLKTGLILSTVTKSSQNTNRELVGQGAGNLVAGLLGAIPGAGTMGATMVNVQSGARTHLSGVFEGIFALAAYLLLAPLLAWIPIAALAAILCVIGARMIDWPRFALARSRTTVLDFAIIAAVVVVANTVSLIAATGVGLALSIVLYLREQIADRCVARKTSVGQQFSKKARQPRTLEVLYVHGGQGRILELQGSLFFGNAHALQREIEAEAKDCRYLVVDLRRVRSMDLSAAETLRRIGADLAERGGKLLFSSVPEELPNKENVLAYLEEIHVIDPADPHRVFDQLTDAIEWVEDEILDDVAVQSGPGEALSFEAFGMIGQHKVSTIEQLKAILHERVCHGGEIVFRAGDVEDTIFFITQGSVRIDIEVAHGKAFHVATYGPGDFFGELAFLDAQPRSATARADVEPTRLLALSRREFDSLVAHHHRLGLTLTMALARQLAQRLRQSNAEIQSLREA
jgi:SulP family sulfate permease